MDPWMKGVREIAKALEASGDGTHSEAEYVAAADVVAEDIWRQRISLLQAKDHAREQLRPMSKGQDGKLWKSYVAEVVRVGRNLARFTMPPEGY